MTLVHVVSMYQLLSALVYCQENFSPDNVTLLIASALTDKFSQWLQLNKYFANIIEYEFAKSNSFCCSDMLESYFDGLLKDHGHTIDDFDNLYVACAHHSFGIYVAKKGKKFIFMEDGSGALSRPHVLEETETNKEKYDLAKEYGLYDGSNPNIVRKIYNPTNQEKPYTGSDGEKFDVVESFAKLDVGLQRELINIFCGFDRLDVPADSALVLTEHFANLGLMSWEEQTMIYQLLVDYFLGGRQLVFKPHPDDLMYYKKLFPDAIIIKERFPAELLPFVFDGKIVEAATLSSSSIYGIRSCFKTCLEFNHDFSYQRGFHAIHKYYTALTTAKSIAASAETDVELFSIGLNERCWQNLLDAYWPDVPIIKEISNFKAISDSDMLKIVIVDRVDQPEVHSEELCKALADASENFCAVFLNTDNSYCFYHYNVRHIWKHIYPISIEKKQTNEPLESYHSVDTETIFLFSQKGVPRMMDTHKDLEYCGLMLDINCFDDRENRIRALEGMLKATEARLLYYINKDKCKSNATGS